MTSHGRDWADFALVAPDVAAAGRRLFAPGEEAPIGFLATAGRTAASDVHLAPVCPIFAGRGIYLSVATESPKRRDLDIDGRYALHAFLGASDEEFRITGHAILVDDLAERARVQQAIEFGTYDPEHPVYRLMVDRALWGYWEHAGQPNTKPVRRTWRSSA